MLNEIVFVVRRFLIRLLICLFLLTLNLGVKEARADDETFIRWISASAFHYLGPVVVSDLKPDGQMEILAGANNGFLYGVDSFGNDLPGFPVNLFTLANPPAFSSVDDVVETMPAIADLDGDGVQEIIASVGINRPGNIHDSKLLVLRPDGNVFPNWPVAGVSISGPTQNGRVVSTPLVWDFDHDGESEIAILSAQYITTPGTPPTAMLYLFKNDGTLFNNTYPKIISNFAGSSLAVGDLDNDGIEDILIRGQNKVYAIRCKDGSDLPGWPVTVGGKISSLSVGDVDNDGNLNVVVLEDSTTATARINVLNANGTQLTGWPRTVSGWGFSLGSPSLADLDGDQTLEIAFLSDGYVNVLKSNGTPFPGWPQPIMPEYSYITKSNVTIADINGDSSYDLVFLAPSGKIYAWSKEGNMLPGFPAQVPVPPGGEIGSTGTAMITDLRTDGDTDVVMSMKNLGYPFEVGFFSFDTQQAHSNFLPWPALHRDSKHSGLFPKHGIKIGIVGDGIVNQLPLPDAFGRYQEGFKVQLHAIPNTAEGWIFRGWRGDLTGNVNPAFLQMNSEKSVTAYFRRRLVEAISGSIT